MVHLHKEIVFVSVLIGLIISCAIIIEPAKAQAPNSWTSRADIPTERFKFGVAAVNGEIYAIGGWLLHALNTPTAINEEYNPANDSWVSRASMPTPMHDFGIAVCQNKIYCFGGYSTQVYDPSADAWTTKTPMPTPRADLCANTVNGTIYLIGGLSGSDIYSLNEAYNPQTDTWTEKAPLPIPVYYYVSTVIDDKIYVIGGYDGQNATLTTQVYDAESNTWTMAAPVPISAIDYYPGTAAATTGVFAPKRIFVIGGSAGRPPMGMYSLNTTLIYDPENDSWNLGTPMPTPRTYLGVAVVDDVLYAIGGNNWDGYMGANEQYTPPNYGTISPSPTPSTSVPEFSAWIIFPLFAATLVTFLYVRKSSKIRF